MAYMNQERKAKIAAALKKALAGTGLKYTLSVQNHSSISMNIKSGPIDFIKNYNETVSQRPGGFQLGSPAKDYLDVNHYWYHEHFTGKAKDILGKIIQCMKAADYYDNSDAMTDYFDTAYYYHIHLGRWNKPYQVTS
jgi:hypothetical protein